jgi:hypothetical protein
MRTPPGQQHGHAKDSAEGDGEELRRQSAASVQVQGLPTELGPGGDHHDESGVASRKPAETTMQTDVAGFDHLLVTDRGEVIAELSPPGQGTVDASVPVGILALAKRGMLTLGSPGDGRSYPALPRSQRGKHSAAEMLAAERGNR